MLRIKGRPTLAHAHVKSTSNFIHERSIPLQVLVQQETTRAFHYWHHSVTLVFLLFLFPSFLSVFFPTFSCSFDSNLVFFFAFRFCFNCTVSRGELEIHVFLQQGPLPRTLALSLAIERWRFTAKLDRLTWHFFISTKRHEHISDTWQMAYILRATCAELPIKLKESQGERKVLTWPVQPYDQQPRSGPGAWSSG